MHPRLSILRCSILNKPLRLVAGSMTGTSAAYEQQLTGNHVAQPPHCPRH